MTILYTLNFYFTAQTAHGRADNLRQNIAELLVVKL